MEKDDEAIATLRRYQLAGSNNNIICVIQDLCMRSTFIAHMREKKGALDASGERGGHLALALGINLVRLSGC
jgi:hypothetical protein